MTAARWARILRRLGHRVAIANGYGGEPCDLLVALHARKSASSVFSFRRLHRDRPVIVALTGTDVYNDLETSARARAAVALATRIVVLQPLAARELPRSLRRRVKVIYQSALPTEPRPRPSERFFEVAVVGHLRPVKDPFRTALAVRGLPRESRIRVLHAGAALSASMARRAIREQERNPRYRWMGELSHGQARRLIARCRLLVLSSRMEGGAHVVSEAVVDGVPILASRIPGTIGLLGPRYPGTFRVGDTRALRRLLLRSERDPSFLERLRREVRRLRGRFEPARETRAWASLLDELGRGRSRRSERRARPNSRVPSSPC
jgi:putative glycosyltransferase (TIGR04348 family)